MSLRFFALVSFFVLGVLPSAGFAQLSIPDENDIPKNSLDLNGGFAKPYEYERQAYGYDPEGVEYHENQPEDFQVIFISSAPFAAGASFLLTGLTSMAMNGNFQVGGNYFLPFLGATLVGSTTIACVSVLTNKYPPPASSTYVEGGSQLKPLAFDVSLVTARF